MIIHYQNSQQSRLTRSAYMTSALSNKSILFRSSLQMNFWMLNFLFYIWKEHSRILPLFQNRTLSVPAAIQRMLSCLSQRIILTWEFRDMTDSSSKVETFQIHTVYGMLSVWINSYHFGKPNNYRQDWTPTDRYPAEEHSCHWVVAW